jgi:hypothetical protein
MRESGRMFFLGIIADGYVVLVPLVILAVTLYVFWKRARDDAPVELHRHRRILLLVCYLFVYGTLLVILKTFYAMDPLSPRLLAPLYLPAACFLFLVLDEFVSWAQLRHRRWLHTLLLVAGIGFVAKPLYGYIHEYRVQLNHGPFGPHSTEVRSWSALTYLEDHHLPGPIYSNRPGVLNYLLELNVNLTPRRVYYASSTPTNDRCHFQEQVHRKGRAFIVWYRPGKSDWLWDRQDLLNLTELTFTTLMESSDSVIYEVTPASPAP